MRVINKDDLIAFIKANGYVYANTLETFSEVDVSKIIHKMTEQLKIYAGCKVCVHCDKKRYPLSDYCRFGGCSGCGQGIVKEDKWEYDFEYYKEN